jgi:hypothetical protein
MLSPYWLEQGCWQSLLFLSGAFFFTAVGAGASWWLRYAEQIKGQAARIEDRYGRA